MPPARGDATELIFRVPRRTGLSGDHTLRRVSAILDICPVGQAQSIPPELTHGHFATWQRRPRPASVQQCGDPRLAATAGTRVSELGSLAAHVQISRFGHRLTSRGDSASSRRICLRNASLGKIIKLDKRVQAHICACWYATSFLPCSFAALHPSIPSSLHPSPPPLPPLSIPSSPNPSTRERYCSCSRARTREGSDTFLWDLGV